MIHNEGGVTVELRCFFGGVAKNKGFLDIYPMIPVHPYNGQTENHFIMFSPICAKTRGAANNNKAKNSV